MAIASGLILKNAESLPAIALPDFLNLFGGKIGDPHAAWRYTLMSGLIPAIPLIVIRPFLPESPKWAQKKQAGTLKRPSIAELFSPELRKDDDSDYDHVRGQLWGCLWSDSTDASDRWWD